MRVLTILNHGTANSTNIKTSEGCKLVISKLAESLNGFEGTDWMLNEGAGTKELRQDLKQARRNDEEAMKQASRKSSGLAGVAGGQGVEANVTRSVEWVRAQHKLLGGAITVNLAGHSRGSITCYKIARALSDDKELGGVTVNIFAIDPVPGNTGTLITGNGENYKNLIVGGNVVKGNSFLLLAESEHRLVFRPYVDALYSIGLPNHAFDTIPGTHGEINMLMGPQKEAASIVLSRALSFLKDNGSPVKNDAAKSLIMDAGKRLKVYANLMLRIKKYKAGSSVNPFRNPVNFAMSGFQIERHRVANVNAPHKQKAEWGAARPGAAEFAKTADETASEQRRKDHHGLKMSEALEKMLPGAAEDKVHSTRPHRFFANLEHQRLCEATYGAQIFEAIRTLERRGVGRTDKAGLEATLHPNQPQYQAMSQSEKHYLERFCAKRGITSLPATFG